MSAGKIQTIGTFAYQSDAQVIVVIEKDAIFQVNRSPPGRAGTPALGKSLPCQAGNLALPAIAAEPCGEQVL